MGVNLSSKDYFRVVAYLDPLNHTLLPFKKTVDESLKLEPTPQTDQRIDDWTVDVYELF
jgi:hypothetical protein